MRCDACGGEVRSGDAFCPSCGAEVGSPSAPDEPGLPTADEATPTSAGAVVETGPTGPGEPTPPAADESALTTPGDAAPTSADEAPGTAPAAGAAPPPPPTVGAAEVRAQLAERWKRLQTRPVGVGIVAALGAFVVLLLVAAVLAFGLVKLLEDQVRGTGDEEFVHGLFGSAVVFVTKYFVFAFNWLPVHLGLFGGLGFGSDIGAREGVTVHAAVVAGMPAVGFILHRAGRWAAKTTTAPMDERTALVQGGVVGLSYAVLLVLFATLAAGNLKLEVAIFEGRASIGPNRLFALVVASALGAFFAAWGTVPAVGGRPWAVAVRQARARLDWLVSAVAVVAAWAAGQLIACVVGAAWLAHALLTTSEARIGESSEALSRVAIAVAAVVYSLNYTTILLLRGMGVPLHNVGDDSREALDLAPLVQVGATVVAIASLILAGYLAHTALRRRFDAVRVVSRVAVCFALLAVLLSRVGLVRADVNNETSGTTASILWVFVIALVEAGALGMVGAQLAERGSLPLHRVRGLRWFAGPVVDTDEQDAVPGVVPHAWATVPEGAVEAVAEVESESEAEAEPAPERRPWSRGLIAALAAFAILPLLAVAVLPTVVGRESPASAVRRYLADLDEGNADAVAGHVKVPGGGPLLSAEAARAMVRENPVEIDDIEIGETREAGGTTVVEATYTENGEQVRRTFQVAKAEGRRRLFFWPVWVVVVPSTTLSIEAPEGAGQITVDGIAVQARFGRATTVDVLDGLHDVRTASSGLLEAAAAEVDTRENRRVRLEARLSAGGRQAVRDAVLGHFRGCEKSTSLSSTGCPQRVFPRGSEQQNVTWKLDGDPTADIDIELRSDGTVVASGRFSMTVNYDWTSPGFFGPPETGHETAQDEDYYTFRFVIEGGRLRLTTAGGGF